MLLPSDTPPQVLSAARKAGFRANDRFIVKQFVTPEMLMELYLAGAAAQRELDANISVSTLDPQGVTCRVMAYRDAVNSIDMRRHLEFLSNGGKHGQAA